MLGKKIKIIVQNHAERPFTRFKKYLQKIADRYINAYLFASHDMGMDNKGQPCKGGRINQVMEVSSVFSPLEKEIAKSRTGVDRRPVITSSPKKVISRMPITTLKNIGLPSFTFCLLFKAEKIPDRFCFNGLRAY